MRYIMEFDDSANHRIRDTVTGACGVRVPYGSLSTYTMDDGRMLYGASAFFSGVLPTESVFEIVFPGGELGR